MVMGGIVLQHLMIIFKGFYLSIDFLLLLFITNIFCVLYACLFMFSRDHKKIISLSRDNDSFFYDNGINYYVIMG